MQVVLLTMIACRSPPAFLPPSISVSGPNGYGPLSPSLAARTVPGEGPEPCRGPGPVPGPAARTAVVPQAVRNASAASVARVRAGVVRSGLPTGLILPRQAQRRAVCAGKPRPARGPGG